jgi:hypothetical protein
MLANICSVVDQPAAQVLFAASCFVLEARDAVDGVAGKVKTV